MSELLTKPPKWTTFYRLGVELDKQMPKYKTLEEIGTLLGRTKQNTYTDCVLALGKLAWLTHRRTMGKGLTTK